MKSKTSAVSLRFASLGPLLAGAVYLQMGCNVAGATAATGPAASAQAHQIYTTRCASCHGASGVGDGHAAAAMHPRPPNFHDASWQSTLTDRQLEQSIEHGGLSIGHSPLMPGNPDLVSNPAVVTALVQMVRSFGR